MRISDNRYSRDRFRLDLAFRFIRHEARTQTIRAWTGLSDDRIRKLYRGYLNEPGFAVSRPRGKSPQQSAFFTRSPRLKEESSFLASVCSLLGVLPRTGTSVSRQALANLSRGELLCQAFEVYHDLVADPHISFEHLVFLVCALAEGEELTLASCEGCGALTVDDRISFKARQCLHCANPPISLPTIGEQIRDGSNCGARSGEE
jgi:Flagellar transcriptional activator (FlhC)